MNNVATVLFDECRYRLNNQSNCKQWESFKRENFHKFRGFGAISESFFIKFRGWAMCQLRPYLRIAGGTKNSRNFLTNLQKLSPSKVTHYTVNNHAREISWNCKCTVPLRASCTSPGHNIISHAGHVHHIHHLACMQSLCLHQLVSRK